MEIRSHGLELHINIFKLFLAHIFLLVALVLIVCHICLSSMQNTAEKVPRCCLDKVQRDLDNRKSHAHQGHTEVTNFCFYQILNLSNFK